MKEYGTCVRMTDAFKKKHPGEHVQEFGSCVGIVQGLMFPGSDAPELDVRWHPSNLRYGYLPKDIEIALPVTYYENFVPDPDQAFAVLRDELVWERRVDAPRNEYYCNDINAVYGYGRGKGRRFYEPRPYHPVIMRIRHKLEDLTGAKFEVCFLNRYRTQSDQLGWHADDSPEMDDTRPIASVSLGVEREIWFRPKPLALMETGEDRRDRDRRWRERVTQARREEMAPTAKLKLGHGSLCLMAPGMQDTDQHRIPKANFKCGERISLTFRGYVQENR